MERLAGIVRPARRPAGWSPPGPRPLARPDVVPGPDEDLCYLCGDWRILQRRDGHRWSLDDLVTAWAAASWVAADPGRVLDLGCGIGSVLLMLAWRFPRAALDGIEAQVVSADLARRSIAWNGADDRCRVHTGDLRDGPLVESLGRFDLVTGTPPYLPIGSARESRRIQKGPCNFEHRGGIEDYCAAAARALAPGGVFVTCEQAAQEARVHDAARAAGLAIACSLAVVPRDGKPALFAVHAMRRETPATCITLPALVVRDGRGARTAEFGAVRAAMGMPP
jgi:tRNA1(Val) A37 N6-methylase TrmN6